MNSLSKPLPACFRINPEYPFRNELKAQLQEFAGQSQIVNGVEVNIYLCLLLLIIIIVIVVLIFEIH